MSVENQDIYKIEALSIGCSIRTNNLTANAFFFTFWCGSSASASSRRTTSVASIVIWMVSFYMSYQLDRVSISSRAKGTRLYDKFTVS